MDFFGVGRPSFFLWEFYWAWFFSEGQEFIGKRRKKKKKKWRGKREKEKKKKKCWVGQARS